MGRTIELSAGAARHVQVRRMQPDMHITLFDGLGGEYDAVIEQMTRSSVRATVLRHDVVEREASRAVHLALGVPANERMDWLVEKATELGVASIQPLMTERGVLRLEGERAEKKRQHWHAIAAAACEQSGRNRLPIIHLVQSLREWLILQSKNSHARALLSLRFAKQEGLQTNTHAACSVLSGAEGGLTEQEEQLAIDTGFVPTSLGNRVLRAETAALAALVAFTL
jgi:16S rRNA (uracil1498-N3)-methyltransferase